jgi:hypothetical protein
VEQLLPIHGKNTFRPSGNPIIDPPERETISQLEWTRSMCGLNTLDGMRAWHQAIGGVTSETAYWYRIRSTQLKSPRARKRAEERQQRRHQACALSAPFRPDAPPSP